MFFSSSLLLRFGEKGDGDGGYYGVSGGKKKLMRDAVER